MENEVNRLIYESQQVVTSDADLNSKQVKDYHAQIARTAGDYSHFSMIYHTLDQTLMGEEDTEYMRPRVAMMVQHLLEIVEKRKDKLMIDSLKALYAKHSARFKNLEVKLLVD